MFAGSRSSKFFSIPWTTSAGDFFILNVNVDSKSEVNGLCVQKNFRINFVSSEIGWSWTQLQLIQSKTSTLTKFPPATAAPSSCPYFPPQRRLFQPWTSSSQPPRPSSSSAQPSTRFVHHNPGVRSDSSAANAECRADATVVAVIRRIDASPIAPPRPSRISTITGIDSCSRNGQRLIIVTATREYHANFEDIGQETQQNGQDSEPKTQHKPVESAARKVLSIRPWQKHKNTTINHLMGSSWIHK